MINERSLATVEAARLPGGRVRPLYDSYGFARIPGTLLQLFGEREAAALPGDVLPELDDAPPRVVAVLIDALGWAFAERFATRSPLLARVRAEGVVSKLTTQFPSTTTAHVTTLHTAQPVGEHGAYEWFIYEPTLDRLVCPLTAGFAGEPAGGLIAAGVDLGAIYPRTEPFSARVGGSARPATSSSRRQRSRRHSLASWRAPGSCTASRARAPGPRSQRRSPALGALPDTALPRRLRHDRARARARRSPFGGCRPRAARGCRAGARRRSGGHARGTRAVFADHGQLPTDPECCVYVNERCPELVPLLRIGADGRPLAPAGSARDLFLHVREGALDDALGLLEQLFGDDAWVVPTAQLAADGVFGPRVSARFRERVGDLVVLPRAGIEAWWREPGRFAQKLRGHHGGLEPAEAETWLGALVP